MVSVVCWAPMPKWNSIFKESLFFSRCLWSQAMSRDWWSFDVISFASTHRKGRMREMEDRWEVISCSPIAVHGLTYGKVHKKHRSQQKICVCRSKKLPSYQIWLLWPDLKKVWNIFNKYFFFFQILNHYSCMKYNWKKNMVLDCYYSGLMIDPGGIKCTSNSYLILSAVIIFIANWHHFSNGCFIQTIWLMSHCAISLIPQKITNCNDKDDISLSPTDSPCWVWGWSLWQSQNYTSVHILNWQQVMYV